MLWQRLYHWEPMARRGQMPGLPEGVSASLQPGQHWGGHHIF